jgi:hypothetical protein
MAELRMIKLTKLFFITISFIVFSNLTEANNLKKEFTYLICKNKLLIPVSDSNKFNVFIKFFHRVNDSSIEEYPNSFHYASDEKLMSGPGIQVELLEAAPHDNKAIYEFMPGLFFAVQHDDEYSHNNKFSLDRKTLNLTYSEKVQENFYKQRAFRFYEGSEKKCKIVSKETHTRNLQKSKDKILKFNKKNLDELDELKI